MVSPSQKPQEARADGVRETVASHEEALTVWGPAGFGNGRGHELRNSGSF